ncbi:DUF4270 family protein [uncultured Hymenobacter sp.]|uniref:DUF4270 family protein n=1 Tax=uncultured Hymenobacter sp. TaxID=170016 RepID=UPI0035C959F3
MSNRFLVARRGFAGWGMACLLAGVLTACEDATDIGAELPPFDTATGTIYLDTLTVRTSTVLVDSVPTSTSNYLLLGRYTDARLGTMTARSYARLGLAEAAFEPASTVVYDSLVLVLKPDTYRYGDTTRTQQVQVHRLQTALRPGTTYYAFNSLSYDATPLGTRRFRARPNLDTVRVRLSDALGQELLTAGAGRHLTTDEQLAARLPGLVLTPEATDNAAMLRFDATNAATALVLYYHEPSAPNMVLSYAFSVASGGLHFYQLHASRTGTALSSLVATRQALPSARTVAEAYIQGGLGLQLKVEIPYLLALNELGGTRVINSASITLEVVRAAENQFFPPPASLTVQVSDKGNRSHGVLSDLSGIPITTDYSRSASTRTNLDQGSYAFDLTAYCTAVLKHQITNDGLLLASSNLDLPDQVVVGGSGNATHPLSFRLYMTRIL